jgi:hypothetical protein
MAFKESSGYCKRCERDVLIRRECMSTTALILFSVLSGGILLVLFVGAWFLDTLLIRLPFGTSWRCTHCGLKIRTGGLLA